MKNKHLTLSERFIIMKDLNEGCSFKYIGKHIGKDCTTISKEVRNHITFEKRGGHYRSFNDCKLRNNCNKTGLCKICKFKSAKRTCKKCDRCSLHCLSYEKEVCSKLEKAPYVCNGCKSMRLCTLEKRMYYATYANDEYNQVKSESRSGINISERELSVLDDIISPLLRQGHSIHHICESNPGLVPYSEKTLYKYVGLSLFKARNLDMPRVVRFRVRKKKSVELKVDKKCRIGRTYDDFKVFMNEHNHPACVQIDSVEGVKGGAVLLTIHFVAQKFQLAFKRDINNSDSVVNVFNHLYDILGRDTFMTMFPVILADNGHEFSNPSAIEFDKNGLRRTHLFYCNPSAPFEKGACENNHEFIRRIIPKGVDFSKYDQDDINLMMSHINSYSRYDLAAKTPYDCMNFFFGEGITEKLKIKKIKSNEIVLKPSLLEK